MKKLFRSIAAVMCAVFAAATFSACSQQGDDSTITFGTNAEFPPFEFVTANGVIDNYDGIDMAIAKKIAEDNGKTAKIENMEFDSLLIALENGQVDACIAGMTITPKKAEEVDFSTPYYTATQVIITFKDSEIKNAKDLIGKKVSVVQGYTGETSVQNLGIEDYISFKKGTEALLELTNKKCDAFVIDSATAQKYVKDNPDLVIIEDTENFTEEKYGIAVKKGNTELLEMINKSIEKMLADGTISELAAQYA